MQVTNCRYTSPGLRCRIRSASPDASSRSEEHTSELQSQSNLVCRLLLEKKKTHQILKEISQQDIKYRAQMLGLATRDSGIHRLFARRVCQGRATICGCVCTFDTYKLTDT